MATLGTTAAIAYLSMGGSSSPDKKQAPPINASSKDEEQFIQYVGIRRTRPSFPCSLEFIPRADATHAIRLSVD